MNNRGETNMQIFALYKCPVKSAKLLDNRRLVKQILETAQMLCTVVSVRYPEYYNTVKLYRPVYANHPCTQWAIEGPEENLSWLFRFFDATLKEYQNRFGRVHKCAELYDKLFNVCSTISSTVPVSFLNFARNKKLGIDYTYIKDANLAYRLYLRKRHSLESEVEND